jgi:hypothetical protein
MIHDPLAGQANIEMHTCVSVGYPRRLDVGRPAPA